MAIPKYDEIQFQALQVLKDDKARKAKDFNEPLTNNEFSDYEMEVLR
jgi:hypothetical protein